MRNIGCEVIRDLLPLYHDGVCSAESKSLVEEHLKTCPACQRERETMDMELSVPHREPRRENALKAAAFAWKKGKKRSFVKGILLAVLVCGLLAGSFVGLTQWKIVPVSTDLLEVDQLSQLSDGSIVFQLSANDNKNLYYVKFTTTEDGCFYMTPMRSVIETARPAGTGSFNKFYAVYPPGFETTQPEHPGIFLPESVTKLYVGPVGGGILVWEEGMELPAAREAVQQMYSVD